MDLTSNGLLEKEKLTKAIHEAVRGKDAVAAAYLMGSYADGSATRLSDVDVGIGVYPRPGIGTAEAAWPALKHRTAKVYNQLRPRQNLVYTSLAQYLETLAANRCIWLAAVLQMWYSTI